MFYTISNLIPAIYWIVISGSFLTAGDIALRMSQVQRWETGFYFTFGIYMIGIFCMMMSFFQQNIAIATVAAVVVNTITYLIAVYFIYGDTISLWQGAGIALGLAALMILELTA